jgi:hypothetical protein
MEVKVMKAQRWLEENKDKMVVVFRYAGGGFWKEIDPAEVEEDEEVQEIEQLEMEVWLYLA